jgi:hypothetical protein
VTALRASVDAFLGAVRAGLAPNTPVLDGAVPDGTPVPYVVVTSDGGWPEADRLTVDIGRREIHPRVKAVGRTPKEAQNVAELAQRAVLTKRLPVDGATTGPVRLEASMTVTIDVGVTGGPVWFTTDQYALTTVPA